MGLYVWQSVEVTFTYLKDGVKVKRSKRLDLPIPDEKDVKTEIERLIDFMAGEMWDQGVEIDIFVTGE